MSGTHGTYGRGHRLGVLRRLLAVHPLAWFGAFVVLYGTAIAVGQLSTYSFVVGLFVLTLALGSLACLVMAVVTSARRTRAWVKRPRCRFCMARLQEAKGKVATVCSKCGREQ